MINVASTSMMPAIRGIAGDLTAVILAFNEAPNLVRTLDALPWVKEILVIDSGSTDETLDIVKRYANARVVARKFDTAAAQGNFGLSQVLTTWVLSMDADYEVSPELAAEILKIDADTPVSGFQVNFTYRIYGRQLRGSLYPPRTVLYRRDRAHYRDHGHTQRVVIDGEVRPLMGLIHHDDRKPLARWLSSQLNYARREADYLLSKPREQLRRSDRIRLMGWPAPILVFFYTLLWKRCILDGWPGWFYVAQRLLAETMIAVEIIDRRLRARLFGRTDC